MQEKNITGFYESLSIDLITKDGNIKYNLSASKHLTKLLGNAKQIIVLIHGFLESSDGVMVQGLAPMLLKQKGLLVLALDGRKVINLEYFRSSTYARFMGEKLGIFLGDIIKAGQDPSKITLIGHSLGAHIAGITGQKVYQTTKKKVARIAALDPAGPCFGNASSVNRLNKEDAEYVDVIHTNAGILGLIEPAIKIFMPMVENLNQDACCQPATTLERGSSLLNLSTQLIIFLLVNVKIGQHSKRDCVLKMKWLLWALTLNLASLDFISLIQRPRHLTD
ncbi:phospholipase A1 2-like isoform X1 [Galleria mellonella]|uniref:Phospholipase A1 2-like isoform X1 n=1 Tax=Galleria mellonella TaxID=7137 RepID=A0ABM3MD28_GALME|nr:phospholipase A1 2-like isoform X1 [Galleria mellonella]